MNQAIQKLDDSSHIFFLDFGDRFLQPDGSISAETMKDFLHIEKAQIKSGPMRCSPSSTSCCGEGEPAPLSLTRQQKG